MKKSILFLGLFVLSLYADLNENSFKSVYSYMGSSFNKINNFAIENIYNSPHYRASFEPRSGIPYKNNFRVFVPKYTEYLKIGGTRIGSNGWLDYFISFNKKPDIYKVDGNLKDIYKSNFSQTNVYDNDISTDYSSFKDNLFKNSKTYKTYNSPYLNLEQRLNGHIDADITNGWLYYATDIRPRNASEPNALANGYVAFIVKYYFDMNTIDNLVSKMDLTKKSNLLRYCSNEQTRNICLYIKSFEDDGSDSDIGSHSITASTQNSIFSGANQSYSNINLAQGWNLVGVHYNNFYFSTNNNQNINYYSFNDYWKASNSSSISTASTISYIQEKNAFWAYSPIQTQIKLFDTTETTTSSTTIHLKDGWNMIAITKNVSNIQNALAATSCADIAYKYLTNNWSEWDKTKSNNSLTNVSKNDGLWVRATGNCNLTY